MKLSQGVEWGLHCTTLLAQAPGGVLVPRDVLARHYGLPEAYLAKHLRSLARADLLHATSGAKGGYRLSRPADKITVLDVVEAIEGTGKPFVCQEIRQCGTGALTPEECRRPCVINAVMSRADQAWRETLQSVTVADLVGRLPARIQKHNWEKVAAHLGETRYAPLSRGH
jgi:Rrf2 family protein